MSQHYCFRHVLLYIVLREMQHLHQTTHLKFACYCLRPKMIVLLLGVFFWSQNDCLVICLTRNWGSKSSIFAPHLLYQEVFQHHDLWGNFKVVDAFYFKSHTYNYSVNGQHALISPKLETRTIILGRRECIRTSFLARFTHYRATYHPCMYWSFVFSSFIAYMCIPCIWNVYPNDHGPQAPLLEFPHWLKKSVVAPLCFTQSHQKIRLTMSKMNEKLTWNLRCCETYNVWWSLKFCNKMTQVGCSYKRWK